MLLSVTVEAMRNNNPFIFLLLLTFGVEVRSDESGMDRETRSICGEDALLRCWATTKPGVQYRSVIWYKVSEASSVHLSGLVMKKLTQQNSTVQKYKGVERNLMLLEDSQSLILPNVTLQDSGRYRCFLSAPLGHQNQEGEVHLRVYEGLIEDDETSQERDTIFLIIAITLLIVSLLMVHVSHKCLKSAIKSYKSRFTQEKSKRIHQIKDSIIRMESKGIARTVLPQEYV